MTYLDCPALKPLKTEFDVVLALSVPRENCCSPRAILPSDIKLGIFPSRGDHQAETQPTSLRIASKKFKPE